MGINLHTFNFLYLNSKKKKFGKTLTLGKLKIFANELRLKKILMVENFKKPVFIDEVLKNYFGATLVDNLDINDYEGANIIHDLNKKIPKELEGKYDTVIDSGTLEHIFDVKMALNNISTLCKKNSMILHISPTNNFCGHGFYQFSPELFNTFYSLNKNYLDTEIYLAKTYDSDLWFKINKFSKGKRINIISNEETYVLCKTILADNLIENDFQQSDYKETYEKKINQRVEFKKKNKISKIKNIFLLLDEWIPFIKKIYNFYRKYRDYKKLKLNKNNSNIEIINVKNFLRNKID